MPHITRKAGIIWAIVLLSITIGCTLSIAESSIPSGSTLTISPIPENADVGTLQISNWETIAPGLERRTYLPNNAPIQQILALRIDPVYYTFQSHYRPGEPLTASEWRQELPDAAAFINSNFFDANNNIVGMLITDGVVYGQAYQDRGGMFAIQRGLPYVRSNRLQPYAGEAIEQAVQAFPMLVLDGTQAYTSQSADRITRRTAIGQDSQGRIVLMVTPLLGPTLLDLSAFLAQSDMDLVNAFNLDGGGSTMMVIAPEDYLIASRDPVPAVLAIYPR